MSQNLQDKITEYAERLTIEYANLSGRESVNRAEFRERAKKILTLAFREQIEVIVEMIKEKEMANIIFNWPIIDKYRHTILNSDVLASEIKDYIQSTLLNNK